jgi:hypothetical protein
LNWAIDYELGQSDLAAFIAHHAEHAPCIVKRNRRMRWIWAGVFALTTLASAPSSPTGAFAFATVAVVFLVFYARFNRWWYVRHNRRLNAGPDGPRLGHTKLELRSGEIAIEAPEGSSKLSLSAIRRIEESDSHYFIYLGPVSAIILPKSGTHGDQPRALVQSIRDALDAFQKNGRS